MTPDSSHSIEIPERYEDVTAEWLTQALRAGGVLDGQTVNSFHVEPLGAAKSRNSSIARISLDYDVARENLPETLIAKFVSRIPGNRQQAAERDMFKREASLYRRFGHVMPINVPKMYFGQAEQDGGMGVLLLEEVEAISSDDALTGDRRLSESEIKLALRGLAKLHSEWWEDESLENEPWLGSIMNDGNSFVYPYFQSAWDKWKGQLKPVLPPAQYQIFDGVTKYLPDLDRALAQLPSTLCHGDCHASNLMWDRLDDPGEVWFVDWQRVMKAPAITDLPWLLSVQEPDNVTKIFLPEYLQALSDLGKVDCDMNVLLDQYRYGLLYMIARGVVAFANLEFEKEDIAQRFIAIMSRLGDSAEDMGCGELIA